MSIFTTVGIIKYSFQIHIPISSNAMYLRYFISPYSPLTRMLRRSTHKLQIITKLLHSELLLAPQSVNSTDISYLPRHLDKKLPFDGKVF